MCALSLSLSLSLCVCAVVGLDTKAIVADENIVQTRLRAATAHGARGVSAGMQECVANAADKGIEQRPKKRQSFAKGFGTLKKKKTPQNKIYPDLSQLASDGNAATAIANDEMYDAPSHCTHA